MKRRSFRISQAQAELLEVPLLYFLTRTEEHEELKRSFSVHREFSKKLLEKLKTYEWSVKENDNQG